MKRIVIDARELRTSTGRYVERLLYYLQKIDDKNHYTVLLKPEDFDGWASDNQNFEKMICPHKEYTLDEQLGLKKQLDGLRADLVHFPMAQQPVLYKGKTVTTINDLTTIRFRNPAKNSIVFWYKQRVYAWLTKRVAKKSVRLLTYSQFVKDDIVKYAGIDPSKVTITHLAADEIEASAEPLSELEEQQFLLYVGRPMAHKNLKRLIKTFDKVRANKPGLKLVLAGKKDGNYERLEAWTNQQGVKNVIFTGFISEGSLRWLYENCQAYVFPSLSEGFGLPGLEAMAEGAPVVSSNATCLPEIYGQAANYFDPTNILAMTKAIEAVLDDKNLRDGLIQKGHQQAKLYSWQKLAAETLKVYKAALAD